MKSLHNCIFEVVPARAHWWQVSLKLCGGGSKDIRLGCLFPGAAKGILVAGTCLSSGAASLVGEVHALHGQIVIIGIVG